MRLILAATGTILLAACGGLQTGQANTAEANSSAPAPVAAGISVAQVDFSPVAGDQAKSVMHERHEGMEAIGKANKAIKRELDGASPDLAAVRPNAAKIADLSQKAVGWFHAGTGPDIAKTGAKPEIWQNEQDVAAKLGAFQAAARAFDAAAAGTDVAAAKASFGELGKACKACHDKYRAKMKH